MFGLRCVHYYKGSYYCLIMDNGCLVRYSTEDGVAFFIGCIRKDNETYFTSVLIEGKVYYIPWDAREICVYDIEADRIEYLPFYDKANNESITECSLSFVYGKYIYIILAGNNPLVKYDVNEHTAHVISDWNDEIEKKFGERASIAAIDTPCVANGIVWLPLSLAGTLLRYDLNDGTYNILEAPDNRFYTTVSYYKNNLWLTGEFEGIVKWDLKSKKTEIIRSFPPGFAYQSERSLWKGLFLGGIVVGERIIYAPLHSNMYVAVDAETSSIESIMEIPYCSYSFMFERIENGEIYTEINEPLSHRNIGSFLIQDEMVRPFELCFEQVMVDEKYVAFFCNKGKFASFGSKELFPGTLREWIKTV